MSAARNRHRTISEIFVWPLVVGVLSLIGLVAALIGDGLWDAVSWATLLPPVAVVIWAWTRRTN